MSFEITKVDVWSGELNDRPGSLATKLEAVQRAGANLDFVIVRPLPEKPGMGVVFLAPVFGAGQTRVAQDEGLNKANFKALRVVGPDRPGLGAAIARALADEGLNIRGLSAAAVQGHSVFYLRFETESDANRASQVLAGVLL